VKKGTVVINRLPLALAALVSAGLLRCGALRAQAEVQENEAAIVLEMSRLMEEDPTLPDPDQRRQALLANQRQVPPLLEAMDRKFPAGRHRPLAHSLALEALGLRRSLGDGQVTPEAIAATARALLALSQDEGLRAQAEFTLLQVALEQIPVPATAPSTAATAPGTRPAAAQLADLAGRFVRLAGDYPRTHYAPPALFLAGGLYLELDRGQPAEAPGSNPSRFGGLAVAAFDRLSRDYPKDPCTLKALMVLVQLHTQGGRAAEALLAKRRCVENFPDSPAALKYRSDIAQAETVGKPFFLRFKSVQGQNVDVRDWRDRTVLVYFFLTLSDEKLAPQVVADLRGLARLANQHKAALIGVGADEPEQADKVAKVLADAAIDAPVLIDGEGKVAQQYGVLLVPSVVLVAPGGAMRQIVSSADIVADVGRVLRPSASGPVPAPGPSTRPAR
jgi:peroxiredoxin